MFMSNVIDRHNLSFNYTVSLHENTDKLIIN